MMKHIKIQPRGFTVFFAVLVATLALSIGLAIYDITYRQLALSSTELQSQDAIYAADSGLECAIYWNAKYQLNKSAFRYTNGANNPAVPASGILCNGQDIAAAGTPPAGGLVSPATTGNGWTGWNNVTASSTGAITTFTLLLGPSGALPGIYSHCAVVSVWKTESGTKHTIVTSTGYNYCQPGFPGRVQRVLQADLYGS